MRYFPLQFSSVISCTSSYKVRVTDHGFLKVDSTTRAGDAKEVEFKTSASHNLGSGKLGGNLDVKYKIPAYGKFPFNFFEVPMDTVNGKVLCDPLSAIKRIGTIK